MQILIWSALSWALCIFLLASSIQAQTDPCEEKEALFKGCVGEARKSVTDFKTEEKRQARKEQLKVEQAMCLSSNGCFGDPEEIGTGCADQALKRAQVKLEKCTGTDLTKLIRKKGVKRGSWGRKGSQQLAALKNICPGGTKYAKKAYNCLRKKKRDTRKEAFKDRKVSIDERKQVVAAVEECEKKLPAECIKDSQKERKKEEGENKLCDCAQKLKSDVTLAAELESCATLKGVATEGEAQGETAMDALISKLCLEGRIGNMGEKKTKGKKKARKGNKGKRRRRGKGNKKNKRTKNKKTG